VSVNLLVLPNGLLLASTVNEVALPASKSPSSPVRYEVVCPVFINVAPTGAAGAGEELPPIFIPNGLIILFFDKDKQKKRTPLSVRLRYVEWWFILECLL
jgi:hypothetical protein